MMNINTVLFDLDGTLLPMDNDIFTEGYFKLLTAKAASHGYEPKQFVDSIWAGISAMVKNNGTQSNEEAFWKKFAEIYGQKAMADKAIFDEFYCNEFQEAKAFCQYNPKAPEIIRAIKKIGIRTVLATNPVFPTAATERRVQWAGLKLSDFELCTTYENIGYCKPNPDYYREILSRIKVKPEECLMVGNDVTEDMIAETVGMNVFLLTDCLINREHKDITQYHHGSFEQLFGLL